jgi:hypothetical protein
MIWQPVSAKWQTFYLPSQRDFVYKTQACPKKNVRLGDVKREYIVRPLRWISMLAILMAAISTTFWGQESQTVTREEARRKIQEGNAAWGNARVTLDKSTFDKSTFEKIMAPSPDFYVQLSNGRRVNREQFLALI